MKYSLVFLISFILINCQTSINKDFKISIITDDKIISYGDDIKINIESKSNIIIDSVKYFLNDVRVKNEFTISNVKLGTNSARAEVFSGGKKIELTKEFDIFSDTKPNILNYEIINEYSHDKEAYTQGLEFYNNILYESTGLNGKSTLRKVDLNSGDILNNINLEYEYFGEGITILNDRIFLLTWKNKIGFIYDLDFKKIGSFNYDKSQEGWGLTNDGKYIYKSDGTSKIWKLDPYNLEEIDFIEVMTDKSRIKSINELEYINGKIFANTYQQNRDVILIINSKSGKVESIINFSGIRDYLEADNNTDVMNGIAENDGKLYVTGKNWNKLFEIKILDE
ncbi:MAG: glutaminyl-peptide cyclotransferase [Bacteroidota bacterium]